MHTLARGQTSSASNPLLDTFLIAEGLLTNVFSLAYKIDEFVTSTTTATVVVARTSMNTTTDRVSTGRYAVPWTVGGAAAIGKYRVTFYFVVESGDAEQSYNQNFEVISAVAPDVYGAAYASVASLRAEGVPASYSDALLHSKLVEASREVDSYCQRSFGPRYQEVLVDGTGARALLLEDPIIGVSSITLISSDSTVAGPLDLATLRVYNRHLSNPYLNGVDDRENPKIEFFASEYVDAAGNRQRGALFNWRWFPKGHQNCLIKGVFGYSDPDGTPAGSVPRAIAQVTRVLALKNLPLLTDADGRTDASAGQWNWTTIRTKEQSISRFSGVDAASRAAVIGALTGDPSVDSVLVRYRRGARYGSA